MELNLRSTPPQLAQVRVDAGCAVVFEAAPQHSATYPLSADKFAQIGSIARDVAAGLGLPQDAATFGFADITGEMHQLSELHVQQLYIALRDYVQLLQSFSQGTGPEPPQPVVIPPTWVNRRGR